VRIAERWLGEPGQPVRAAILARLDDESPAVRRQLAASLGAMPKGEREAAVASMLERHADDSITLDAALSGVQGSEVEVLGRLLALDGQTAWRDTATTVLAATILRGAEDAAVQRLFEWAGEDGRAQWQRSALLRGAEVALLGAAMPGTAARIVNPAEAALPCPTCPGGRAGPGGSYAFSKPEDFAVAGSVTDRRRPLSEVHVSREPTGLSSLAAGGSPLAGRAAIVLARVTWPGKPGVAAATPLSAEEQQRFDAGREVYRNICQACHQPDGRGQDRLAPSLIGSPLLFAPVDVPARILLKGKEGAVGLMPPIGAALSDDQVAGVLTYVRRAWGQSGAPVDPETVKAVRAATATRTRPWTDDELFALAGAVNRRE